MNKHAAWLVVISLAALLVVLLVQETRLGQDPSRTATTER